MLPSFTSGVSAGRESGPLRKWKREEVMKLRFGGVRMDCVICNFFFQCTEPQKLFNIANELLHTEEAYVKRLHLLDQVI